MTAKATGNEAAVRDERTVIHALSDRAARVRVILTRAKTDIDTALRAAVMAMDNDGSGESLRQSFRDLEQAENLMGKVSSELLGMVRWPCNRPRRIDVLGAVEAALCESDLNPRAWSVKDIARLTMDELESRLNARPCVRRRPGTERRAERGAGFRSLRHKAGKLLAAADKAQHRGRAERPAMA
jgi:hypothetical protein